MKTSIHLFNNLALGHVIFHLAWLNFGFWRRCMVHTALLTHPIRAILVGPSAAVFKIASSLFVLLSNSKTIPSLVALILVERAAMPILHLVEFHLIRECYSPNGWIKLAQRILQPQIKCLVYHPHTSSSFITINVDGVDKRGCIVLVNLAMSGKHGGVCAPPFFLCQVFFTQVCFYSRNMRKSTERTNKGTLCKDCDILWWNH